MSDSAGNDVERCPQCGAEFVPSASPLGVCPACLLKLGASDPAIKVVPTPDDPNAPSEPLASPPATRWGWRRAAMGVAAIAVLPAAVLAFYLVRRTTGETTSSASPTIRFLLPPPDETDSVDGAHFAVSPDGTHIVLAARSPDGQSSLWLRTLQSMEWRRLPSTEGATLPFWSPDSQHVGFFAERKLKRTSVANGLIQTLAQAPSARGGTWGRDGTIVFAPTAAGPIVRVRASGGTPEAVTTLDKAAGETSHAWPHFLPNGRSVLLVVAAADRSGDQPAQASAGGPAGLHLLSLESGQRKLLLPGASTAAFAQGFLLFVRGTELLAQRFNPDRGELEDGQRAISGAERVSDPSPRGYGFGVSDAGVLVHRVGGPVQTQLTWFDRSGHVFGAATEAADYQQFAISPDSRRIAAARRDARDWSSNIWLIELDRQTASPLTLGTADNSSPLWLPDGRRIAFVSRRAATVEVYMTDAEGGGKEEHVFTSREPLELEDVSPDGRFLVYSTGRGHAGSDVWFVPLGGERKPQPLLQTDFNESEARLSPDGRWMAYVSDESGRDEVYVRAFPQADGRWQVSAAGGRRPRWRRDGRELFYISADRHLVAVDTLSGPPFRSGAPRTVFVMGRADEYDVVGDGHRFLAKTLLNDARRNGLQVILNWAEELRR
jgi:Tol biopolymer transport system component